MTVVAEQRASNDDAAVRARHAVTVPLIVEGTSSCARCAPITVGVPFPKGTLRDADSLELLDAQGSVAMLQTQPLARWSDGSVKWLVLDFLASEPAGIWQLRTSPAHAVAEATLLVRESADGFVIDTGEAVFHLDRTAMPPLRQVIVHGDDVINAAGVRTVLTDARGREHRTRVERVELEATGPVRATLRIEGTFGRSLPCRFVARCCFFAGTGLVRVRFTLHNPNRAHHRGGLWDLGDRGSVFFRDLSINLGLRSNETRRVTWSAEAGDAFVDDAGPFEIYQDSSGGENWRSRNHVNRDGRVPCRFRGYLVRAGGREHAGLRASPVVCVRTASGCVSAAVPEFWQQFPKAIEVEESSLRVQLFPRHADDLFELQGGEQKTHCVWLHFGDSSSSGDALNWVHSPPSVRATPKWYASTAAVPNLSPATESPNNPIAKMLLNAVRGDDSLFAGREVIDEYGWRNYGEVYADHEAEHYDGPAPVVSHYNNQYDLIYGAILQFLRTGASEYVQLFDPLARHVIDIDIYHTTRDRSAYNGGMFWHTDHYRDAATCTHRSFSRANAPPGRRERRGYGGGPCNEHNYTSGLLHYHYLTGDPQARDAVIELADWVIRCDDGTRTILGIVDDGPTGLASATRSPDHHGPGRGAGNSVNALLDAWLLSDERHYLHKAEELIRRVVHPHRDVAGDDLLNVEERWSYTVFLRALARYLDVKAEAGELDEMYAYARACLHRYAQWMLRHERACFENPDQLEFPTETWAAHDLRKANVLRLAARHAAMPLRADLLRRGDELADRATRDLLAFPRPDTARALTIMMVEQPVDECFRASDPEPAPNCTGDHVFVPHEPFVPQRERVAARLSSAAGVAGCLLRLLNVRRWHRYLSPLR